MPVKSGEGTNVTVPSLLTVYVPSPETVRDVLLQTNGPTPTPHNFNEVATAGKPASTWSFESGLRVCVAPFAPLDVSFIAAGTEAERTVTE